AEEMLQIAYDTIKANRSSEHKDVDPVLLHAIESHTEAHTKALEEELQELRAWKESASAVMNEMDLQAIGKKLGIGLGESISASIGPKIDELLERIKEVD